MKREKNEGYAGAIDDSSRVKFSKKTKAYLVYRVKKETKKNFSYPNCKVGRLQKDLD